MSCRSGKSIDIVILQLHTHSSISALNCLSSEVSNSECFLKKKLSNQISASLFCLVNLIYPGPSPSQVLAVIIQTIWTIGLTVFHQSDIRFSMGTMQPSQLCLTMSSWSICMWLCAFTPSKIQRQSHVIFAYQSCKQSVARILLSELQSVPWGMLAPKLFHFLKSSNHQIMINICANVSSNIPNCHTTKKIIT